MSVLGAKVKFFALVHCDLSAAARWDKLESQGRQDDVPISQLVAQQQGPVLPDHNFDLNTPNKSPEFPSSYLFKLSHRFDIDKLQHQCQQTLKASVGLEAFPQLEDLADSFHCVQLKEVWTCHAATSWMKSQSSAHL